jgi:hypothetical protein
MNGLVENQIKFFDCVTLFADFWKKNSHLEVDLVLSSLPDHTKVVFRYPAENEDEVAVFQQHALRYFKSNRLVSSIVFKQLMLEVFMDSQDV